MNSEITIFVETEEYSEAAKELAEHLKRCSFLVNIVRETLCSETNIKENNEENKEVTTKNADENPLMLKFGAEGLSLTDGHLEMRGDYTQLIKRLRPANLNGEFLVKAARLKNGPEHPLLIDATAGMGEDSLLLAAAGFNVILYEYNPIIAALLKDTIKRASLVPELSEITARMTVVEGDSTEGIKAMAAETADVILLDPMFPERQKSALIKKKFQLLHRLEMPCVDEKGLLEAALTARPRKIIIKRPLKGPYLAGIKPDYSLMGKAVRVDCILPGSRT